MFNKTADAANHLINQSAQSAEDTVKQSQNLANNAVEGLQGALQDMRRTTERLRVQARQPRGWTLSCERTLLMRWVLPRWPGTWGH